MIRFINLKGQIYLEDEPCFAFYNTITDEFITLIGNQTWDDWKEFEKDYYSSNITHNWDIDRFKSLIPEDFF